MASEVPTLSSSRDPVFALSDAFVDEYAELVPLVATFAGLEGHDDRWGDLGPEGLEEQRRLLARTRERWRALPPTDDADAVLARRVLGDLLDTTLEEFDHDDHLRDLAHLNSTVPHLRDVLEVQDTGDRAGRQDLLARLESLPAALAGWRRRIERGLERSVLVPRRQVESVAAQLRASVAPQGAYPRRVEALAHQDPALAGRARASLAPIIEACEQTVRFLEERYLPLAPTTDGVGPERYLRSARSLLGTTLDPREAYDWAWGELSRVTRRARRVAARIVPDAPLGDVLALLQTDPAYAAGSPERFRELMLARQESALERLRGTHFDVPETIHAVDVRLTPPGGAIGAYYVGPSEDFSRPGSIWWSLADTGHIPLFEEVSTAYHEGFPGHHLQTGIQMALADRLSRVHRLLVWWPGYGEGWALYAETLMDELGALERPEYELGYLTSSLLRIVRVLVDIGLHLDVPIPHAAPFHPGERWTFELAVEALEELTGLDHEYATSEVTRYLGWPAQAITYALGQRTILDLREQRRAQAGFDLRAFHADVLGSGPVGLDHLRELVLRDARAGERRRGLAGHQVGGASGSMP